jgi:hypothetical protein
LGEQQKTGQNIVFSRDCVRGKIAKPFQPFISNPPLLSLEISTGHDWDISAMKMHKAFSIGHTNYAITFCGLKIPDGEYYAVSDRKNWITQREILEIASENQECNSCAAIDRYREKGPILDVIHPSTV